MMNSVNMNITVNMDVIFEEIRKAVEDLVVKKGMDADVTLQKVLKNNGVTLTGLLIKEHSHNITPSIYIDNDAKAYLDGEVSLELLVERLFDTYEKHNVNDLGFDVSTFFDFNSVKHLIVPRLVNKQRNAELLEEVPYVDALGGTYVVVFVANVIENGTILIRNQHLYAWGCVSIEELQEIAFKNLPVVKKPSLINMMDLLSFIQMGGCEGDYNIIDCLKTEQYDLSFDAPMMFVLSSEDRSYGAVYALDASLLSDFCHYMNVEKVYIIPSSVHECILVPDVGGMEPECFNDMIGDVNSNCVDNDEVLGSEVILYDNTTGTYTVME